jgi:hypothetical protein
LALWFVVALFLGGQFKEAIENKRVVC